MRSLVRLTDVDVLPADRDLLRRDDHWVIRSPSNPQHYWGNLLLFDRPPELGDGERWEALFVAAFPGLDHRTFAWDVIDGSLGGALAEFPGYYLDRTVGLVAAPRDLTLHPRSNREVTVRSLAPADELWEGVFGLWEANNLADPDPHPPDLHRTFLEGRKTGLQRLLGEGRGAWFVALDGAEVVGSLGIVVTEGRARYQVVDTRPSHRGRGIASRLVLEAAQLAAARWPVDVLVIAADLEYHALGIYESLGFTRTELVSGVGRWATRAPITPSGQ